MLENYVHKPAVAEKVTLLKSFQTGNEFASLPFASATMDSVFRKQPLGERRLFMAPNHSSVIGVANQTTMTHTNEVAPTRESPLSNTTAPAVQATRSSPMTYAARIAAPPSIRPLPLFGTLKRDVVLVNADGLRVDCPLPPKSTRVTETLNKKTRVGGKRYCNMHHLHGSCDGHCGYLHEPLSDAGKLVLRHRLRGEKCHDRGRCRDPRCFYGHHCSCPQNKKCNFPTNLHNVDVYTWREVATS